jgi:cellulose biosynthesis protein BcsQ
MKTIAFFNNKGGVGKTTLCFHLSHMLSRAGLRVVAADLDPQANLTAHFCSVEEIEQLWAEPREPVHISNCLAPLRAMHPSPLLAPRLREAEAQRSLFGGALALLPGHLDLSSFEDEFGVAWLQSKSESPGRHIGHTLAFWSVIGEAAAAYRADVVLVDIGPNLGAINRAVLLATDLLVIPLAADVFSIQGLRNLGPTLKRWRGEWARIKADACSRGVQGELAAAEMKPVGYVILQHAVRKSRPVKAYQRWFERIPSTYRECMLGAGGPAPDDPADDANCIGEVKHYQSLVPLSQDANKPMFDLTVRDGAIGGHQEYVRSCRANFEQLAQSLIERCHLAR